MAARPDPHAPTLEAQGTDPSCAAGVCGADVPPLVGRVLTGTGLTLDQAARLVLADEPLPGDLTEVQIRLVHEHALLRL